MLKKDIELCLLILDIQYQTQHFFFGKYAHNYYDNMENEANQNKRRRTKTRVAYDNLSEIFKLEDVISAYSSTESNARVIVCRLKKDKIIEELEDGSFKKVAHML